MMFSVSYLLLACLHISISRATWSGGDWFAHGFMVLGEQFALSSLIERQRALRSKYIAFMRTHPGHLTLLCAVN
jgi:hypothetical protein